jgi:EAL domain-containing protein (putative c-di-GMP-specific phosphodiesterase class I)
MRARVANRSILAAEVAAAFERGEITAYFQPQVSTRSGEVTGFEALARWHHPVRGMIPPVEFLPALAQAGRMDRLGEAMVREALAALRHWDGLGLRIPRVGVNFSNAELADPSLVERIGWELDRNDLTPDRLVIEVLENVVANRAEDVVMRNLAGLARLGCCLDLDDFGTGHASITSIRRFSIERIKIDRSFVTRIDDDPEQQKMVSAILTMAERLGLDTLAEGVETAAERAMLAKLGCGHVQGFAIARPMPLSETADWLRAQARARHDGTPVQLRVV